ncbi:kinesin-like protein KIF19 isoform X2 [Hyperolius riggenbachi]
MLLLKDPSGDSENFLRAKRSKDRTFVFDAVFDQDVTQEQVYEATTKTLIEGIMNGYNATVFAYGPTGTGKTYTMLGVDCESGIYINTLNDLFKAIKESSEGRAPSVSLSYLEIYNETIRDLLNPSGVLDLRDDSKGNLQIAGVTEFFPSSAEEAMALVQKGNKHRTQEPTAANKTSSRSHAILQVIVKHGDKITNTSEESPMGKLFLIDLAGSERASQTMNLGKRMKEGAHINRSLLALGNCINALSERGSHAHINYRDSKLTRLLKDALSGNSRTVMIAHVSPSIAAYEESRTTLIYASRTSSIKTRVRRNYAVHHRSKYGNAMVNIHQEIQQLRQRIKEHGQDIRTLKEKEINLQDDVIQDDNLKEQEPIALESQFQSVVEEHMKVRRSLLQLDNANLEQHIDTIQHLATIADWEKEKAERYTQQGSRKVTRDPVMDAREEEEEEQHSDTIEPSEVIIAREELNMLIAKQRETSAIMASLEELWARTKLKAYQLEEQIPEQIGCDRAELFRLLRRVQELQVSNTELLSRSMLKGNLFYYKDFVILNYQHYRCLCEKIIRLQEILIDEKVQDPEELKDLHLLCPHEDEFGKIKQLEHLKSLLSKDDFLHTRMQPEKYGGVLLQLDIGHLDTGVANSRRSTANHTRLTFSPCSPDLDSGYRTAKSTPGLKPSRQDSSMSLLTPFHHLRVPAQMGCSEINNVPPKEDMTSRPVSHPLDDSRRHSVSVFQMSPDVLDEIASGTRSISLVAARRRSRVGEAESPFTLRARSGLSTLPVLEGSGAKCPVKCSHARITPERKAFSTENLPPIIPRKENSPLSKKNPCRKNYWDKRSWSFEVPSSKLTKLKNYSSHGEGLDRAPNCKSPHTSFHVKPANNGTKAKPTFSSKTFVRLKTNRNIPCTIVSGSELKMDSGSTGVQTVLTSKKRMP